MDINDVNEARDEAERFMEKLLDVIKRDKIDNHCFFGCKETGALKRASMDLSHALVKLRK